MIKSIYNWKYLFALNLIVITQKVPCMNINDEEENLKHVIVLVSKAFTPVKNSEETIYFKNSADELKRYTQTVSVEFKPSVEYYIARLYALSGDQVQASKILQHLVADRASLPEAYWLSIQLNKEENRNFRWELEDKLGRMLPLSGWGRTSDNKRMGDEAIRIGKPISRRDWPVIPKIESEKLFKIAELFDSMGLSKEAANGFREFIYAAPPPGFPDFGTESWISDKNAYNWLAVARNEIAVGYRQSAFQALLMAVVSSPKTQEESIKLLNLLFKQPAQDRKPNPNLEKFNQIALLYQECNLHTRSIEALELAENLLQLDLSGQKKSLLKQWEDLINKYTLDRKEICFLFGWKVTETPIAKLIPRKFPYRDF